MKGQGIPELDLKITSTLHASGAHNIFIEVFGDWRDRSSVLEYNMNRGRSRWGLGGSDEPLWAPKTTHPMCLSGLV